jgi:uncharacterized protein (TIGR03118 family)
VAASLVVFAGTGVVASPAVADGRDDGAVCVTNLVSDVPGRAQVTDPDLSNAWGLAAGPVTPIWVADNHTDVSTLYSGAVGSQPVVKVPLVVSIAGGAPTGVVVNSGAGFVVSDGTTSGPARFVFASEGGDITGWNPAVPPPPPSTHSQLGVHVPDAVYKGLALATTTHGPRLYAANFHGGTVDVFDDTFAAVHQPGAFVDPALPAGYTPFDIAAIGAQLYVTYTLQDATAHDDVKGRGHGFIDVYTLDGALVRRFASRGRLNSPWGLVLAPSSFGRFAGMLLVGNFGDGRINAYDPTTGRFRGVLRDATGDPIVIDGLWALQTGNPTIGGTDSILFTAGPDAEQHGLFGLLRAHTDDGDGHDES